MAEETKEKPAPAEKRDWVGEAVKCFIKDAEGIDPANPVRAVEVYFKKNATDELKARCKAEGKDAKSCWKFIEAVARQALNGHNGHIDPSAIYAIAMHWFEDVPADWNKEKTAKARPKASTPKKPQAENSKAAKPKKPRAKQGFFFEMLEMQPDGSNKDGPSSPQTSAGASGEETAMEPSSLPASTSSTESEVQG